MSKIHTMLIVAASTALLSACRATERTAGNEAQESSAAQPETAADEQAIRGHVQRWLELIRNKDAAGIAQFYAEDGAVMPPNMPMAKGRPAVQQVWASMMQSPRFDLTFSPEEIIVSASGDMALDRGTYRVADDTGKYVVVWRKVDGAWKVAADIFNSDKPHAGA